MLLSCQFFICNFSDFTVKWRKILNNCLDIWLSGKKLKGKHKKQVFIGINFLCWWWTTPSSWLITTMLVWCRKKIDKIKVKHFYVKVKTTWWLILLFRSWRWLTEECCDFVLCKHFDISIHTWPVTDLLVSDWSMTGHMTEYWALIGQPGCHSVRS